MAGIPRITVKVYNGEQCSAPQLIWGLDNDYMSPYVRSAFGWHRLDHIQEHRLLRVNGVLPSGQDVRCPCMGPWPQQDGPWRICTGNSERIKKPGLYLLWGLVVSHAVLRGVLLEGPLQSTTELT